MQTPLAPLEWGEKKSFARKLRKLISSIGSYGKNV